MPTTDPDTTEIRLQKFLSLAGLCSRRQGEKYILEGRIRVNGKVVHRLGTKVAPAKDLVEFEGKPIQIESSLIYIALNKPPGYITSCKQPGRRIVLDLIDIPMRIFPIGRLDKDSTGLILLTNDGRLHHRLSHPSFDHEREYDITVAAPISDAALIRMQKGMLLDGTPTRPAKIKRHSARRFYITLKEGRNRQIRRMVRKVDNRVELLKRVRIAHIRLGKLKEGSWRYLQEDEIKVLAR